MAKTNEPAQRKTAPSAETVTTENVPKTEAAQAENPSVPEPSKDTAPPPQRATSTGTPPKPKKPGNSKSSPKEQKPIVPKEAGKSKGGNKDEKLPEPQKPKETPVPEKSPEEPAPPQKAPRSDEEKKFVYLTHEQVHGFKNHPFKVKNDGAMQALVSSIKDRGVDQDGVVRESKHEKGKYEIVAGHRRQLASKLAGFDGMRFELRDLTDDEAIKVMVETNTTDRGELLPSERARAMKMQYDAIKRQGARGGDGTLAIDIVGERNGGISGKTAQRKMDLLKLVPELLAMVDAKEISTSTAEVHLAHISHKNQKAIVSAIEACQAFPSSAQAKRMKELEAKGILKPDVIGGIMQEEKKEEIQVFFKGEELTKYFSADKTPKEMKAKMFEIMDDWAKANPELVPKPKEQDETQR